LRAAVDQSAQFFWLIDYDLVRFVYDLVRFTRRLLVQLVKRIEP